MKTGSSVWHPYTPGIGGRELEVVSARGPWLFTRDKRKILDAIASWWVCLHGHSHPDIARAVGEQALKLEQVIFAGFTHEPAEKLASELVEILPGAMDRIFYSDNGSTAVEVALKMALQVFHIEGKPRTRILALRNAYHGDTFGAMAVGERGPFSAAFREHLFDVTFLEVPYRNPCSETPFDPLEFLDEARLELEKGDVAAVVVEPGVQGAAGMRMFPLSWVNELFSLARRHGTLCIADEVFTGFFRTGLPFACSHLVHPPDILCLSKGLTGGFLPLGVTAANTRVTRVFEKEDYAFTLYHGHSFTANPLACTAARASLQLCREPGFSEKVQQACSRQEAFSRNLYAEFPELEPRFRGNISALTFRQNEGYDYTHELRPILYRHFLERDLLVRPIGNVLYLAPPFCLEEEDWALLFAAVEAFVREFQGKYRSR